MSNDPDTEADTLALRLAVSEGIRAAYVDRFNRFRRDHNVEVANLRGIIDRMAGEHDGTAAERDAFKKALTWIRDNLGAVCDQFEICNHRSCGDSSSAWMIADEFLKGNYELPE